MRIRIGRLAIIMEVCLDTAGLNATSVMVFFFLKGPTLASGTSGSKIAVGIASVEENIKIY